MALSVTHPTLMTLARRSDTDGKIAKIVEILEQTNPIFQHIPWKECNNGSGEKTTVRTGYSAPTWRKLYGGVQPTTTQTAQVIDSCGMLEDYSEVDVALADLNKNKADFRASEDVAKIASIGQEFCSTLFYGDEDLAPEEFTGLTPRFNDQSAANGENILTLAATPDSTDNTSIWLINWGFQTVYGIVPNGSTAGIKVSDKGQVTVENVDGLGGRCEMYRTHYRMDGGICVRDWGGIVRINFDLEDVISSGATGPVLADLMGQAMRRCKGLNTGMGMPGFYASRSAMEAIDLQMNNKGTLAFTTVADATGALVTKFRGIPIYQTDAILNTESGV